ncbi:Uncharacterised protein [Vibrio cholerae]|nr:Uncharacterised protein [Vibrio cholerae]
MCALIQRLHLLTVKRFAWQRDTFSDRDRSAMRFHLQWRWDECVCHILQRNITVLFKARQRLSEYIVVTRSALKVFTLQSADKACHVLGI